jgi:SAM-dependent methyltransferase
MTAVADLKHAHRATWAAGDYAAVAECIDDVPPADLLAHVPVATGELVLDVAAGTGNVAIKAALAGAQVTGLDLTPELLVTAARRAERAGVGIEWIEGDAEALPFDDGAFDTLLSVFGVQFAPRHQFTGLQALQQFVDTAGLGQRLNRQLNRAAARQAETARLVG